MERTADRATKHETKASDDLLMNPLDATVTDQRASSHLEPKPGLAVDQGIASQVFYVLRSGYGTLTKCLIGTEFSKMIC